MALSIKHPEADKLARRLAEVTGEGLTQAVLTALRERLDRVEQHHDRGLAQRLLAIGKTAASLPILDNRTPDEIVGYGPDGLPR